MFTTPYSKPVFAGVSLALTLCIWLWYALFQQPMLLADTGYMYILGKAPALIASTIIGAVFAWLLHLTRENPGQLTSVIRLSRARLINAVLLWLLIPTALFYYLPVTNITTAAAYPKYVYRVLTDWTTSASYSTYEVTVSYMLIQLGLYVALFLGCYLVSSIIVSCTKRRLVKFGMFLLVSLASYAFTLLWDGVQPAF